MHSYISCYAGVSFLHNYVVFSDFTYNLDLFGSSTACHSGLEMRGTQLSMSTSTLTSQILLAQLFIHVKLMNCLYLRYASQREILPESSLNIYKVIANFFLSPLKLEVLCMELHCRKNL